MTIQLITQSEYDTLLEIYKNHPLLTYENKGYDCIDKSKLSVEDKESIKNIETILLKSIGGFSKFQNFTKGGRIRFQYNWSHNSPGTVTFIGVGYLKLLELLNGFDNPD